MKAFFARVLRFTLVGGFASLLYFVLASSLTMVWPDKALISSLLAYSFCIVVSYVLQRIVTFRSAGRVHVEAARFVMVSVLGLILSSAILLAGTRLLGVSPYIAFLLVLITIPVINYCLFNRYVFRKRNADELPVD